MRRYAALIAFIAFVLVGCSHHPALKDAPAGDINNDGAHIVTMPDRFPNISWKCIGGDAVFVNTRDAGVNMVVVQGDANCGGDHIGNQG